jgi:hypothetical protein
MTDSTTRSGERTAIRGVITQVRREQSTLREGLATYAPKPPSQKSPERSDSARKSGHTASKK